MNVHPHNHDIERAVLGACLIDGTAIDVVQTTIGPEAFYNPRYRTIYQAICDLARDHKPADPISVVEVLGSDLEEIGGPAVVTGMVSETATSAYAGHHAEILQGHYIRRCVMDRAEQLSVLAQDPNEPVETLLAGAAALSEDLSVGRYDTWVSANDATEEALVEVDKAVENPEAAFGIEANIPGWREKFGGFHGGDFILVAGRPSMGKTALALWIAREAARTVPVAFISAEMTRRALGIRILAMEAGVDSQAMRQGRLESDEFQRVTAARESLRDLPVKIGDRLTRMGQIPGEIRRLHRQNDVQLLVIDYLQLLTPAKAKGDRSREREVAQMSHDLKELAVELNICVIALAQLNRALGQRPDKRPMLTDLRESGALEQDADLVVFVHREAYYGPQVNENNEDISDQAELIVSKNRNGPVGRVFTTYIRPTGRFYDWPMPETAPLAPIYRESSDNPEKGGNFGF